MTDSTAASSTPELESPSHSMAISPPLTMSPVALLEDSTEDSTTDEETLSSSSIVPSYIPEIDDDGLRSEHTSDPFYSYIDSTYTSTSSMEATDRKFKVRRRSVYKRINPSSLSTSFPSQIPEIGYNTDSSTSISEHSSDSTITKIIKDRKRKAKLQRPKHKRIWPRNKKRIEKKNPTRMHVHREVFEDCLEDNPDYKKIVARFKEDLYRTYINDEEDRILFFHEIHHMEAADEDSNPPTSAEEPPRKRFRRKRIPKQENSSADAEPTVSPDGNSQVALPGPPPQGPNQPEVNLPSEEMDQQEINPQRRASI